MTTSIYGVNVKIERVVMRDLRYPDASFFHLREGGRWLCATAWFAADRSPRIAARSNALTVEETTVVILLATRYVLEQREGYYEGRGNMMVDDG